MTRFGADDEALWSSVSPLLIVSLIGAGLIIVCWKANEKSDAASDEFGVTGAFIADRMDILDNRPS